MYSCQVTHRPPKALPQLAGHLRSRDLQDVDCVADLQPAVSYDNLAAQRDSDMSNGENDFDWLQNFFPEWREEEQRQRNRNNGGPDQDHQLNPYPAFADAAQVAQAAYTVYVRFHHSQSPQARTVQMSQRGQPPAQYHQGMDQTLSRSQLHRHSQYEQPQQQQRPELLLQQPFQQQIQQEPLRQPQKQPNNQAEHPARHQAEQQALQQSQIYEPYRTQHQPLLQPPQNNGDQLQQYYREAQHQHQTQVQSSSRPHQHRTQPPPQQYMRPFDVNPSASYYHRSSTSLAPTRSPVQQSASGPSRTVLQSPVVAHSGLNTGESSRNSTPMNSQQQEPKPRPKAHPLAPGQSQASSKQLEVLNSGYSLEDAALLKPTKAPAVSHSQPSPKPVTSTGGLASVSVPTPASMPMSAPTQARTSGSPPVVKFTPAAVATDRSSTGASTTPTSSGSPPVHALNYAIPPALRVYATPQMHRAYTPPQPVKEPAFSQLPAQIPRSTSAPSVPPITSKPTAPVPQPPKPAVPPQATAQIDNFTPFVPASTPTVSASSTNGGNSPLSSQARLAGDERKRGSPRLYPNIVGPVNQSAGFGKLVDRWRMHSHPSPSSNGSPHQYQPGLSGLPNFQNIAPAPATGLAPAPPPAWRSPSNAAYPTSGPTPRRKKALVPTSDRFAMVPRASLSQTQAPTGASGYNPPSNIAPITARPADQNSPRSLQPPPASQPPAAKIRKLDDGSRQAVTPSKTLDLARYARQSPSRKHIAYRSDIVEQVKISDVLVKTAYDPATIARDILIVADKHPTEKGLNHHLQILRPNFRAVDYTSDLATFRWELVDPYVHYPPGVEEAIARAQQMSTTSASGLVPTARPPNLPLNYTGSASPDEPHLSARDAPTAPLARPAESRSVNSTSTGNIRTAATGAGTSSYIQKSSDPSGPGLINSALINSALTSSGKTGAEVTRTGAISTNVAPSYHAHPPRLTSPAPPTSSQKATPIPPSAVRLNSFGALPFKAPSPLRPTAQPLPPSISVASQPSVSTPVSTPFPAPPPQSSPRKPVKSATVPLSSSQSAAVARSPSKTPKTPSQSPRGKDPRQSSLPKDLPEPQVVISISPGAMAALKKKPARPYQTDVQVEVAIDNRPTPEYQVFQCKWTGCKAELHNLQAIQTHIVGVHIPHHIVCGWGDCTDEKPRPASEMWEHVQVNHIQPLAWQLGDGPSVSVTAADGYELPKMFSQERNDTMTLPADRDSVKIFSRIHGTQTSKQKAQLMEEAGRQWKEGAGPDTDVSDRPLSTPTRLLASSHTETAYTMSDIQVVI
ncbi:hypothetical protein PMG11_06659 [Penicillium brasilianum]|uniref:C2H2-type domain-containing protein n=1 Tax=Penicillium brasilianum TaxID=104259 RepID=A0A0F7TQB7_PENBI|nr:hypothetical protein PMG11_06659 [Penicillium brasilianum]